MFGSFIRKIEYLFMDKILFFFNNSFIDTIFNICLNSASVKCSDFFSIPISLLKRLVETDRSFTKG